MCLAIWCVLVFCTSYRESAEKRVKELQYVLNETFKRFAIDYGEEDGDEQLSDEISEL